MTENTTMIEMMLKVNEQRLIQAFQIHNEQISEQVKAGVEKAVSSFDFEAEIRKQTEAMIRSIISDSIWKGSLRKLVDEKVSAVVQGIVNKEMKRFED